MAAGVAVAASIPIVAGAAGYAIIKGVKYFFSQKVLNSESIDPKWEKRRKKNAVGSNKNKRK